MQPDRVTSPGTVSSSGSENTKSERVLSGLRLVTEADAWQLFEAGQRFADRAVEGTGSGVTPVHVMLRQP